MRTTVQGRFEIQNQTRYNTDDILAMFDALILDDMPTEDRWPRSGADIPDGAVIQIIEFTGREMWKREYSSEKRDWERRRVYVRPRDPREWHVIRVVPPDRIYTSELEALAADMTFAPAALTYQFQQRVSDFARYYVRQENDKESAECFPAVMHGMKLRIEKERGHKRTPILRRTKELAVLREQNQALTHAAWSAKSSVQSLRRQMASVDEARKKLGLNSMEVQLARLTELESQLHLMKDQLETIVQNTPIA